MEMPLLRRRQIRLIRCIDETLDAILNYSSRAGARSTAETRIVSQGCKPRKAQMLKGGWERGMGEHAAAMGGATWFSPV